MITMMMAAAVAAEATATGEYCDCETTKANKADLWYKAAEIK